MCGWNADSLFRGGGEYYREEQSNNSPFLSFSSIKNLFCQRCDKTNFSLPSNFYFSNSRAGNNPFRARNHNFETFLNSSPRGPSYRLLFCPSPLSLFPDGLPVAETFVESIKEIASRVTNRFVNSMILPRVTPDAETLARLRKSQVPSGYGTDKKQPSKIGFIVYRLHFRGT